MSTLEQELQQERKHVVDLTKRAERRLDECRREIETLESRGREAAERGDPGAAASVERRVQKVRQSLRHYEGLRKELVDGGDRLAAEVLLARLEGPAADLIEGEVQRNRDTIVQLSTELLDRRNLHRRLRQRWGELNDKIRQLRQARRLPPPNISRVDLRVHVNPANYDQKPDGPTFREVSDLVKDLGL